jgi:hypothetical protein
MQDVAGRMLDDFAKRFETYLLTGDAEAPGGATGTRPEQPGDGAAAAPPAAAIPPPPTGTDDEALDLGSVVFRTPAVQRGAIAAGVALLILLLTRRGRRR